MTTHAHAQYPRHPHWAQWRYELDDETGQGIARFFPYVDRGQTNENLEPRKHAPFRVAKNGTLTFHTDDKLPHEVITRAQRWYDSLVESGAVLNANWYGYQHGGKSQA